MTCSLQDEVEARGAQQSHTGPCMEAFLHSNILKTMATVCLADKPKSARALLVRCFSHLFGMMR